MFKQCFNSGHADPNARPSALEWWEGLDTAIQDLVSCTDEPNHIYSKHYGHCPWCERMKAGSRNLFPAPQGMPFLNVPALQQRILEPRPIKPLPQVSFSAAPSSIDSGSTATLTWSVVAADTVTLDGQPVATTGSRPVTPSQTTTYTLTATSKGGTVSQTATVTVTPALLPPQITCRLSSPTIDAGQTATLTWSVVFADTVMLDGQPVGATGSRPITPNQTTTYTLTATGRGGTSSEAATITVVPLPAPPSISFGTSPTVIDAGQATTLTWSVTAADTVMLDDQVVSAADSDRVTPTRTTTYTLTATNKGGSVSSTVNVTVIPPIPNPPPYTPWSTSIRLGKAITGLGFLRSFCAIQFDGLGSLIRTDQLYIDEKRWRLRYINGSYYEGEIDSSSQRCGYGVMLFPDQHRYAGQFRDGLPHGEGKMQFADGSCYEGHYQKGYRHGQGVFTSATGDRYAGEFAKGLRHGLGVYTFANGDRYEGSYSHGQRHGQGVFTTAAGTRYEGEFRRGLPAGQGTLELPDGRRYDGECVAGYLQGRGRLSYASGAVYEGEFRRDQRHGWGRYDFADGRWYEGQFQDDLPSGQGVLTLPDGSVYRGTFLGSYRRGSGSYTTADGVVLTGRWREHRGS